MRRLKRRKSTAEISPESGLRGRARVDRRTKNLMYRIEPGEIAVIDHEDMDRISAEGLIQHQVAAVVNASRSSSGRYPNLGPMLLCTAGIPLVDEAGPSVMDIEEGTRLVIQGDRILGPDGREIARGKLVDLENAEAKIDSAKQSIASELERFAQNTIDYIKDERDVLLEATRLPEVKTDFHGRHVLIVVRGSDYKEDITALRSYIREVNPLLVGVDGGADALMAAGLKPDVIIGDMDSVTTEALSSGAELIVHAYSGGHAPGLERIEPLGLPYTVYEATGTSEDIAMLLAYERGAELIVAVGTHANLVEFLDKGRRGMASTFLTRLRVGPILVDAKGVSRLYRGTLKRIDLFMLVAAAVAVMGIVIALSEPIRYDLQLLWLQIKNAVFG